MEIDHEDVRESDKEVDDLFINEDLADWERAAYVAGLSSNMEKVGWKTADRGGQPVKCHKGWIQQTAERDNHAKGGTK